MKSPVTGLLAQLLSQSWGNWSSGPRVSVWDCVSVYGALWEANLTTPPGCCTAGTSLSARVRTAISFVPPQQPDLGKLCFPPCFLPRFPPCPVPPHPVLDAQQKSLVQSSLLQHLLHSTRCWHPKPAAHAAVPAEA